MICKLKKINIRESLGFITTSLSSTLVELGIYNVLNLLLEDILPYAHIVISSILARCASEVVKFTLDKEAVFKSSNSSFVRYVVLAVSKGLTSATLIAIVYYLTKGNRTLIKICVDFILFFPSFLISKNWIHNR